MAFDSAGNLYVATGDRGEIFRVTPAGEHGVFFKSDEAHIRALAIDAKGNVIAGSDGSGLVYRISPSGEAFVLYSAPKKEITALAIDKAGNIYAAGAGEKRPSAAPTMPLSSLITPPLSPLALGQQQPGAQQHPGQPAQPVLAAPVAGQAPPSGGSEIYRISPDGSPTQIWSSREDLVYALAFDPQGNLLAGTGNQRPHLLHRRRRPVHRSAQGQRQPGHGIRASPRRRPLRRHQQSRQSLSSRRHPAIRGHLRERRLRRPHFLPLGTRRIPRQRQPSISSPAAAT